MTLADLTSREAVLKAIDEFDEIGREAFLSRYGFKPSTGYVLDHHGRQYDSKAIVAAAHGFQHPHLGPLQWGDFSGGTPTTTKLETLGFELRSVTTASPGRAGILIGSDDCALFGRYPRKVPFREEFVPPEDKAAFKDLWARLKALAEWIAGHSSSTVVMKAEASHYAQNGYSQRDLWSCAFPQAAANKSYGLQIALIVSGQGAEVCFCLGAGKSQLSGDKLQEAERALRALKGALSSVPESVVRETENLLSSWELRRKWRAQPGVSDFSDLREWLSFASSPAGDGASISRYYSPEELDELGERIGDVLLEAATLAAPLIQYCYLNSGELALLRALSEYEAEVDPDELERTRTGFALARQRFEELFGSPERIDALTAEQFFGFLNDIDSHVSPETGLFTLGPGLPAPKNPELPTWTKLEEDLEKLQACLKLLLFPRERSPSARIDAMLAVERPRRYITEELALPSILLCFVDPVNHAGVQRMPKKQQKLEAVGGTIDALHRHSDTAGLSPSD